MPPASLPYNRGMSHLAILLPFGMPPAELSADLFRELKAPALATLLARAKSAPAGRRYQRTDEYQRTLPHEHWLANAFGRAADGDNSPAVATALMLSFGLDPEPGTWFILQPVHIHIARDHLVLTDPRRLALDEAAARTLFEIAAPLFAEAGKPLRYGDAGTWFVKTDDWAALQTATPDAASGHNIDIWMPKGNGERDWRKLQNEVQMHWFNHAVNEAREARGLQPVNSLWLWGNAAAPLAPATSSFSHAFNLHGWMRAFEQSVPHHAIATGAAEVLRASPQQGIAVLDTLLAPALANDWGRWLERMQALEAEWFAPLLAGLGSGAVDDLLLIASHDTCLAQFGIGRASLKKFWIKPALSALVSPSVH